MKSLTFNYLFTSDNNNPLVDVDATLIRRLYNITFQLNKWPIVECLWKNHRLKSKNIIK